MTTRNLLERIAMDVDGVTRVAITEDWIDHSVELEIEAYSLETAERAAEYARDYVAAGIVMTWIPAGYAAVEALARWAPDVIDWRPTDLLPEDFDAF